MSFLYQSLKKVGYFRVKEILEQANFAPDSLTVKEAFWVL